MGRSGKRRNPLLEWLELLTQEVENAVRELPPVGIEMMTIDMYNGRARGRDAMLLSLLSRLQRENFNRKIDLQHRCYICIFLFIACPPDVIAAATRYYTNETIHSVCFWRINTLCCFLQ